LANFPVFVKEFINIIKNTGITLSTNKIESFKSEIDFLGSEITHGVINLQNHISEKIKDIEENITEKKQIQSILGLANQVRSYIPNLAKALIPLQSKLKKNEKLTWNEKDRIHLQKIKDLCSNLPKLELPTKPALWIIETDASDKNWGAVLKYRYPEEESKKQEKLTRYTSGTFKQAEQNYHINEKELLAVLFAIKKFELFIVHTDFLVRTDNTQVKSWIMNKIDPTIANKRLLR